MTHDEIIAMMQEDIEMNDNLEVKEYKLMYLWGVWITAEKIYAENDKEAVFDAESHIRRNGLQYALWQGNRCVKLYK